MHAVPADVQRSSQTTFLRGNERLCASPRPALQIPTAGKNETFCEDFRTTGPDRFTAPRGARRGIRYGHTHSSSGDSARTRGPRPDGLRSNWDGQDSRLRAANVAAALDERQPDA